MAGYALGFDGGGAIPDDDDNSGAAPVVASDQDNSGAAPPVADAQTPQPPEEDPGGARLQAIADAGKQTPAEGIANFPGSVKRIASYLMGEGAADPQTAKKFELGVQHEYPGISRDDAALLAVQKAFELGGPQAAWQMVQFNRTAYNAKQSFAESALRGVPGKPADPHAAADAATQAASHVLDGSSAQFTADQQGFITATVKMPGSDVSQTYRLSPQQFLQYANVGKDGQWDKVMEMGGVPGTLQRIVGTPGQAQGALPKAGGNQAAGGQDASQDGQEAPEVATNENDPDQRRAKLKQLLGDWPISDADMNSGYDPETIARGYARFGHGMSQNAERNEWMAQQEEKGLERENKVNVASEKGRNDIEKARVTGTARTEAAGIAGQSRENVAKTTSAGRVEQEGVRQEGGQERQKLRNEGNEKVANIRAESDAKKQQAQAALKLQMLERQSQDAQARERGRMARAEIMNPNFLIQDQNARNAILKKYGLDGDQASLAQASPAAPAAQAGAPPRPKKADGSDYGAGEIKLYKGKWYQRGPNGEAVPVE